MLTAAAVICIAPVPATFTFLEGILSPPRVYEYSLKPNERRHETLSTALSVKSACFLNIVITDFTLLLREAVVSVSEPDEPDATDVCTLW